jgi:methylthioribose-1-phosphate isomerase
MKPHETKYRISHSYVDVTRVIKSKTLRFAEIVVVETLGVCVS